MTAFRGSSATDAGRVRSSNQDLSLVSEDLVAVADGMGGHVGGEIAASVAIDTLRRAFVDDRTVSGIVAATQQANRAVFEQSEREPTLRGMGTTLTAAAIVASGKGRRLVVANVGDSRAYVLRDGRLEQLTEDHSLVEEMVRNGELTPAEAAVHPHRHILTRALGIDRSVSVDSWDIEPTPGIRLLLCSDGLTNEVAPDEIATILASARDPSDAAGRLVATALEHGGSDNVTVVVADVDDALPSRADGAAAERGQAGTGARSAGTTALATTAAAHAGAAAPSPPSGVGGARAARRPDPVARPARRAEHVLSLRSVLFVLLFVGVLGGAAGVVAWYLKASYFVGVDHGYVAVFQGRPGGFLWFQPTVLDRSSLPISKVFATSVPVVRAGMLEPSYAAAETIVSNLRTEPGKLSLPTVNTKGALGVVGAPTSTTTTTLAPVATTTTTRSTTTVPARPGTASTTTSVPPG